MVEELNPSSEDYIYHYMDYIQHTQWLMEGMSYVITNLLTRLLTHDRSKIGPDELDLYAKIVPGFKGLVYGTKEHEEHGKKLGPAWQAHCLDNRHHVEHFENGLHDMHLLDLIEMVCDWRAASLRSGKFDYETSVKQFANKNNVSHDLVTIIHNTCKMLSDEAPGLKPHQRDIP